MNPRGRLTVMPADAGIQKGQRLRASGPRFRGGDNSTQPKLLRQADALQLAGCAFGDFGEEEDLARRLVGGEALADEGVQVLLGCRSARGGEG
jgi:hypothetical protein